MKINGLKLGMPNLRQPKIILLAAAPSEKTRENAKAIGYKLLLVMKLVIVIMVTLLMHVSAASHAQKITFVQKDATLKLLFNEVTRQTGYYILLPGDKLDLNKHIHANFNNAELADVLNEALAELPVTFTIEDRTIILSRKPDTKGTKATEQKGVQEGFSGEVLDNETNLPIAGATVQIKDTKIVTATDKNGHFLINLPADGGIYEYLVISSVGYIRLEIGIIALAGIKEGASKNVGKAVVTNKKGNSFSFKIQPSVSSLGEVKINTGMYTRKKESFTGAVSSFTGKELRQISSLNVIQALKTVDPSFIVMSDNLQGSNPNQLPVIEMRGKTSLTNNAVRDQFATDPNQPLFVLDGMETTLQRIVDLDINRVASVTLLKDAASTVMYGSRAANGVVVVETIRPTAGELYISYGSDLRVEMPDLSDYNMMNAAENLEFQRVSGMYTFPQRTVLNDQLYNQRLASVKEGINSDWLVAPLRTGTSLGHSLSIGAGTEEFQYNIGLNHRDLNGVMLGSVHGTTAVNTSLSYRKKKLIISDDFSFSTGNSNESPYGKFGDYVKMNPYYSKYRTDGSINTDKYLEVFELNQGATEGDNSTLPVKVENPLYNASLNSINNTRSLSLSNGLNIIYDISQNFRFSAGLNLSRDITKSVIFIPASNTAYDGLDLSKKGSYTEANSESNNLQANAMLTYTKVFNGRHALNANLRSSLGSTKNSTSGYQTTGFPEDVNGNPAFSRGFAEGSRPNYSELETRRVGLIAGLNYSYDARYSADLNYTVDGSTAFGSKNKFSPFWSTGLAWNIDHEHFLKDLKWLNQLRIRGNIGVTGNQSLGSFVSSSIYNYSSVLNPFGQAIILSDLGNPSLEWQKTRQISVGLDASLFNNRISATVNYYEKLSNPLVVSATLPLSSGVPAYPQNVGSLRGRGVEVQLRFSPVYLPEKNIIWTLGITGSKSKDKYEGFSNILSTLNEQAQQSSSLQRYVDGYSTDEIWSVVSLGIDPATGQEIFLSKDGQKKFKYDSEDVVPIGPANPKIQGVLTSNLNFKGFRIGINLRYSLGAYIFNSALYDKVENISFDDLKYNQDKRALELRWRNPGDQALFKGVSLTDFTPISTRFLQKENFLSGESINVGYQFQSGAYPWLKKLGLNNVNLSATMNDIFRLSTIRSERGIDYPFSNAVTFNLGISL